MAPLDAVLPLTFADVERARILLRSLAYLEPLGKLWIVVPDHQQRAIEDALPHAIYDHCVWHPEDFDGWDPARLEESPDAWFCVVQSNTGIDVKRVAERVERLMPGMASVVQARSR